MHDRYILGIDIGTSKIKAALFNLDGELYCEHSSKNDIVKNALGWVEQDMMKLWNDVSRSINNLIQKSQLNNQDIIAVGVTGQGEGCWLIDKNKNPVGNAILWLDGRAVKTVEEIKEQYDSLYKRINLIAASYPFPGSTSIILKWLKDNNPEILNKSRYCIYCKDWIRYKLTGEVSLELTDASTSLMNLNSQKLTISDEILEILSIEKETKSLFTNINKSMDIAGHIKTEASKLTGLAENTPVSYGMMDIVATALGSGAVSIGDSCTILGTTCCNQIVTDKIDNNREDASGYEYHCVDGFFLNVTATMAGTPNLDWFINNFCREDIKEAGSKGISLFELLEHNMRDIPSGSEGIIFHPYISQMGERAPFYNPNARAQFFGITETTGRYHLLKSIYEGIAYAIKDCLDSRNSKGKIYLAGGGGSKSDFWAQIISDVTGKEVIIPAGKEFTAKGAAISAGISIGVYKNIGDAVKKTVKTKKTFRPNTRKNLIYNKFYDIYKSIRLSQNKYWELRAKTLNEKK